MAVKAKPDGYHAVTPYLVVDGAARLIDFLEEVFDAQEVVRLAAPGGRIGHAELRIGDLLVMLGDAHGEHKPMQTMLYVYVDDADAIYQRALAAGATSVQAPIDQFYGDRSGGVKDPFGNLWWIATHIEDVPPDGTEAARAGGDGRRPAGTDCQRGIGFAQRGVTASRPTFATTPSCGAVPPLAPIAPISLPSTTIGKPPSDAAPCNSASRLSVAGEPPLRRRRWRRPPAKPIECRLVHRILLLAVLLADDQPRMSANRTWAPGSRSGSRTLVRPAVVIDL